MPADTAPSSAASRRLQGLALASYLLLIVLTIVWEGWLAPKSSPAFWLTVKIVPLLWLLPGLLRQRARSLVLASLFILLYLSEGLVLLWTERAAGFSPGSHLPWALAETILSVAFILSAAYAVRTLRAHGVPLSR
jgi:uncharacterized membrane protein